MKRPETVKLPRKGWEAIQAALAENQSFMLALKAHQDMGAELTITNIEREIGRPNCIVEFENAADNLDVPAQERALAALTNDQIESYIQDRGRAAPNKKKSKLEAWIRKLLVRSKGASGTGLNLVEADMLMRIHGHGGSLISHDSLQTQAERKPGLYENTVTWHDSDLVEAMESGVALGASPG